MTYGTVAEVIHQGVRLVAVIAFALAAVLALTYWAVRGKYLNPFGAWPRLTRRVGDPLLRPIERMMVRAGGNPQDAPTWLLIGSVVGGLILIGLTDWVLGFIADLLFTLRYPQGGGGLVFLVTMACNLLRAALLIRIIASWFRISPYAVWMRPVHFLTDWMLNPLRRLLPSMGPFDFSPMAAWFILLLLESLLLNALR